MTSKSRFFDGQTAHPYELDLTVAHKTLIGTTSTQETRLTWQITDIRVVREPEHQCLAVLTNLDNTARLHIPTPLFQTLIPLLGQHAKPQKSTKISVRSLGFWGVCLGVFIVLSFQAMQHFTVYIAHHLPRQWEESLGSSVITLLTENNKLCTARKGTQALEKIISALKLEDDLQLDLTVIDEAYVNAFAAPAGKIVLYRGLIAQAINPTEIAGVLAHEIGHILNKHPTEHWVRHLGSTLISQVLFRSGIKTIVPRLYTLKYSREAEAQADKTALTLLLNHNIDPSGLKVFLTRLEEKQLTVPSPLERLLSTHPHPSERIIDSPLPKGRKYLDLLSPQEWQELKAICIH